MPELGWMDRGACVGHPNPDIFFPNSEKSSNEEAARICRSCPVRVECEQHRRDLGAVYGVWGGIAHHSKNPGPQIGSFDPPHGSGAMYSRHLARGEEPCYRCRFAHRYQNAQREARTA